MDMGEILDSFHIFVRDSTGFSFSICLVLTRGVEKLKKMFPNMVQNSKKDICPRFFKNVKIKLHAINLSKC